MMRIASPGYIRKVKVNGTEYCQHVEAYRENGKKKVRVVAQLGRDWYHNEKEGIGADGTQLTTADLGACVLVEAPLELKERQGDMAYVSYFIKGNGCGRKDAAVIHFRERVNGGMSWRVDCDRLRPVKLIAITCRDCYVHSACDECETPKDCPTCEAALACANCDEGARKIQAQSEFFDGEHYILKITVNNREN